MRAVVYERYGGPDVLHIEDVEKPLPRDDEVLVRINAVAVTRADCATRQANRNSGRGFELGRRASHGRRRPRHARRGVESTQWVASQTAVFDERRSCDA